VAQVVFLAQVEAGPVVLVILQAQAVMGKS
jgi:hypothetical protein